MKTAINSPLRKLKNLLKDIWEDFRHPSMPAGNNSCCGYYPNGKDQLRTEPVRVQQRNNKNYNNL